MSRRFAAFKCLRGESEQAGQNTKAVVRRDRHRLAGGLDQVLRLADGVFCENLQGVQDTVLLELAQLAPCKQTRPGLGQLQRRLSIQNRSNVRKVPAATLQRAPFADNRAMGPKANSP